jgi:NAD+ diphosphatase
MTEGRRSRIALAGDPFDRSAHRRADEDWVEATARSPETIYLAVQGSRNLVALATPARPAMLDPASAAPLAALATERILLGLRDGRAWFALALPREACDPPAGTDWRDLRWVGAELSPDDASTMAYARAMCVWHARHRHCAACGAATVPVDAGHARLCTRPGCEIRHFTRVEPAVIVLVTRGEHCLLGRQASWPPGRYSTIAGFVEPGESLEDAVAREVYEETGVEVDGCEYRGSQPWPFPASLMLGYRAVAAAAEIRLHDEELEDARWVSREDLAAGRVLVPPSFSIAYDLIRDWYEEAPGADLARDVREGPPVWRPESSRGKRDRS